MRLRDELLAQIEADSSIDHRLRYIRPEFSAKAVEPLLERQLPSACQVLAREFED
jgi:hypothetical protein